MRHRFAHAAVLAALTPILVAATAGSALACGGLVTPNGTVSLLKTTTLAAYHGGVEHYVTSFEFAGKGAEVGSIIPLPGVPTNVIEGGDWTLQRLILETQPPVREAAFLSADAAVAGAPAQVLFETEVDALDITVLKGGGTAVGDWAREHGYFLPPDAPEVLEFYADRSPIFLAARFNAQRAADQGLQRGQGTPVHIVIPTPNPWVPLRILALGLQASQIVQADVYLLTDRRPETLPQAERANPRDDDQRGLIQEVSEPASGSLLADLRSDRGMAWLPAHGMWLTYIRVNDTARNVTHDLAIDASGYGRPNPVAAGYPAPVPGAASWSLVWTAVAAVVAIAFLMAITDPAVRRAAVRVFRR